MAAGLGEEIVAPVRDLIRRAMRTGQTVASLLEQVRRYRTHRVDAPELEDRLAALMLDAVCRGIEAVRRARKRRAVRAAAHVYPLRRLRLVSGSSAVAELLESFAAALEWWGERNVLAPEVFARLADWVKGRAGALAHQWDLEFVSAVYGSLEAAASEALTVAEWLPKAQELLDSFGAAPASARLYPDGKWASWYADLVYRNAQAAQFASGTLSELWSREGLEVAGYWQSSAIMDGRVTDLCASLNGRVFAKTDTTARRLLPPRHHQCRCSVIELDADEVERRGLRVTDADSLPADMFPPPGWDADRVLSLVPGFLGGGGD